MRPVRSAPLRRLAWSLVAGCFLALATSVAIPDSPLAIILYLISYACGAFGIVAHSIEDLRHRRALFALRLPILLAAVGAALMRKWFLGALLLFLFSLLDTAVSLALESAERARGRNS